MIYEDFDQKTELMYARRDEFVEALKTIEGTVIHGLSIKFRQLGICTRAQALAGTAFLTARRSISSALPLKISGRKCCCMRLKKGASMCRQVRHVRQIIRRSAERSKLSAYLKSIWMRRCASVCAPRRQRKNLMSVWIS